KVVEACHMISDAGIDWLKTSSGLWAGPSMEDVELILNNLNGTRLKLSGVKAPRAQNSYAFLMAGAEIIGTQGIEEVIEGLDTLRRVGVLPEYEG
ncbi:MAG: deoxyribose-phosphate aldolase, partial [Lachnospiraceae bacterium]|nr:deoxyribose-phosphate aldolase [Lachnospiraceae bacterium]